MLSVLSDQSRVHLLQYRRRSIFARRVSGDFVESSFEFRVLTRNRNSKPNIDRNANSNPNPNRNPDPALIRVA